MMGNRGLSPEPDDMSLTSYRYTLVEPFFR